MLSVRFEADGSSVLHLLARTKRGPQQVPLKGNVLKCWQSTFQYPQGL